MNAQNMNEKPVVKRETKNKIRVSFDRTPLKERLKAKFLSSYFLTKVVFVIFRLVLMVGISYIVLYPFLTKFMGSIMAPEDFVDVTVMLLPKTVTLDIYRAIITELDYWGAFANTFTLSFSTALIQTFICCLIGYGFAKFKFKGRNLLFMLVMLTMIVPHQTVQLSLYMAFRYFDILGILSFLSGGASVGFMPDSFNELLAGIQIFKLDDNALALTNTYWPLAILSVTGLAFKNGLYIFLLRQFFTGVPDALEESAYIDGSGVFHTFFTIILPLSVPMMVTVFLFAFCWQWTDDFYTTMFFTSTKTQLLTKIVGIPDSLKLIVMWVSQAVLVRAVTIPRTSLTAILILCLKLRSLSSKEKKRSL